MKILRYLMMAILIVGMSGVAHAAVGFTWNLQDPTGSSFVQVLPGVPFAFSFDTCIAVEGTPSVTYTGCANGQNISPTDTLTSFEFTFSNIPALNGEAPACVSDSFAVLSCSLVGDEYILSFNCPAVPDPIHPCGIAPNGLFNIYENALPGSDFPDVAGVANFTPEPSSIWLALSGMGSLGYLVRRRRRASSR
jgi:hypothetical protein